MKVIYECRCDERLKVRDEGYIRLTYKKGEYTRKGVTFAGTKFSSFQEISSYKTWNAAGVSRRHSKDL
jgi:hypothetical protein